jgi:putrescine transport system permease protein
MHRSHPTAPPALEAHWSAYKFLFTDSLYVSSYLYSLKVAAVSMLCCLLIGYPMAYAIARSAPASRSVLLMLIVLPFWTSFLLRVYAWIGLLQNNGVINNVLLSLHVIETAGAAADRLAVYIGTFTRICPSYPAAVRPEKVDSALLEAVSILVHGR